MKNLILALSIGLASCGCTSQYSTSTPCEYHTATNKDAIVGLEISGGVAAGLGLIALIIKYGSH